MEVPGFLLHIINGEKILRPHVATKLEPSPRAIFPCCVPHPAPRTLLIALLLPFLRPPPPCCARPWTSCTLGLLLSPASASPRIPEGAAPKPLLSIATVHVRKGPLAALLSATDQTPPLNSLLIMRIRASAPDTRSRQTLAGLFDRFNLAMEPGSHSLRFHVFRMAVVFSVIGAVLDPANCSARAHTRLRASVEHESDLHCCLKSIRGLFYLYAKRLQTSPTHTVSAPAAEAARPKAAGFRIYKE